MNLVVGIGDLKVTAESSATLITYSLGSCIGVAVYDPVAGVGGLLHFMLPDSRINPDRAKERPAVFADTGVPLLLQECEKLGAQKGRLQVKVAGGAQILDSSDFFKIGKRNLVALKKVLWQHGILIHAQEVGGTTNRTMGLDMSTGTVWVKISGDGVKKL